jgi:hypothetical protein
MRLSISLFIGALTIAETFKLTSGAEYGVDCSFPIHYFDFRCGDLLGDRKTFYEDFMQGKKTRDSNGFIRLIILF